jgi:serine protease inhibitor
MSGVGDGVTDLHAGFAIALLGAAAPPDRENVVVSPWSVSAAPAVLAPGVEDAARQEIEHALAARADTKGLVAELVADASKIAQHGVPGDDSVLAVANDLWVDEPCTPVPGFVGQLEDWPEAALRFAPIRVALEQARAAINAEVAQATRDLIKEILPAGSITSDDRAVIVSALYLLAGWLDRFDAAQTADEPFQCPSGTRNVATMRGWREAGYARDDWEYLALPLWLDLRVEVLLPPETAPETSPGSLDASLIFDLRRQAAPHHVDLRLPRFRVEWRACLIPALRDLGVEQVFDPTLRAVCGVVTREALYVSGVFHAAVLRVDERGVEGAAATAIVARTVAAVVAPRVEMRVDRPFFFLVTHRQTGAVIFLAYVAEP